MLDTHGFAPLQTACSFANGYLPVALTSYPYYKINRYQNGHFFQRINHKRITESEAAARAGDHVPFRPVKHLVALYKILPAKGILRMRVLIRKQSGSVMSTARTNLSKGYSTTVW